MQLSRPACLRATLVVALLLAAALPAQAQWKWRDKSGRITASDLPPPREVADKDILQRPNKLPAQGAAAPAVAAPLDGAAPPVGAATGAAPAAAASAAPLLARPAGDKELDARKRAAEQEQQARAKAAEDRLAAQRADNCRRARTQMAALETGQRMSRTNDKGEREMLDDKGRAEEMRRAGEAMAADCK